MAEGAQKSPIRANPWERFLAGQILCPFCSCCTWFVFGLFWLFLFVAVAAAKGGDEIFSFDEQSVQSDPIVQAHYAFQAARGGKEGCEDEEHKEEDVCKEDDKCEWIDRPRRGICKAKDICPRPTPREREDFLMYNGMPAWVGIIYEAQNGGNILDDDILGYIDKFENELLTSANGATMTSGAVSKWDEDWCKMTYPMGGGSSASGKCGALSSFVNPYSMNAAGLEAVKAQVQAGYTYAGFFSCICTVQDQLCAVCNSDGSVKNEAAWPTCFQTAASYLDAAAAAASANTSSANNVCAGSSSMMTMTDLKAMLQGFCASKPSCQFTPPGASRFCSSTAFYRPTDTTGLLTGADKDAVIDKMCDETQPDWYGLRSSVLPMSFDCTTKKTSFGRTQFFAGGNGKADSEDGDAFEKEYVSGRSGWFASEQKLELDIEKESGGKLRIMLFSAATTFSQFMGILRTDALLSITSLILVWVYMWWTLESCFLASVAMFEIVFSLPVSMSIWFVICGQKISFLQMLTIYMILGIGADDAFILYDAWIQAQFAGEEINSDWTSRFAWAYRRAFRAMLVTTATTCGSFLIGAASPLPQVRDFCIFAALVVLVDWLFCITLFASAVVVHDKYFKSNTAKGTCGGPGCCCGVCRVCAATCCKVKFPEEGAPPQKRAMERWCEGPVFNCLKRFRIPLVVLWVLIIVGMLISAGTGLRTAEKAPPIGKESLDVIRGFEILLSNFQIFGVPTTSVAWGLDEEDPMQEWGDSHADDVPRLSDASAARVTSPVGQKELLELCRAPDLGKDAASTRCDSRDCLVLGKISAGACPGNKKVLRETGIYIPEDMLCATGRYCFMEEFARYWAYKVEGADCQGKTSQLSCPSTCNWDSDHNVCYSKKTEYDYDGLPADDFIRHLGSDEFKAYKETRVDVLRISDRGFDVTAERANTGFQMSADKSKLKFAWVSFNATYPRENSVDEANTWYDRWEAFHNLHAPDIGGVQTTELYLFMVTQNEMVKAAIMGVVLSLVIAFLVMKIATGNWWVALLGLVNISGITSVFLGFIPLIGWSLGENECIFLIAVVGLSVDYTVHLLHVYNHSPEGDRESRTLNALAEMGISVTNSAITTLLASVILFNCGFYFFFQFGGFIFLVIGFSILMSITFLIPIMLLIGPQNEQGNIPCLQRNPCKRVGPEGKQ